MKLGKKGFTVIEVLVVLMVLAFIGGVGWYAYQNREAPKDEQQNISSFEECKAAGYPIAESYPEQCHANGQTFVNETQEPLEEPKGKIAGKASYPGERLPDDLEICAENVDNYDQIRCLNVGKAQKINYELSVPVGIYHVYSATGLQEGYKAYYNEYVKCGLRADCPAIGHSQLIQVKVEAGQTARGVDPGDWYNEAP